jgi:tripartite-type tricarboxylate transporter receptor subunit TctC
VLFASIANAQSFPQKPLRLIVPFTAGGASDIVARMVASELTDALGQNVVVENRGGGGAVIGTEIVARAPPDGHTLGMITPSFTINGGVRKLPYDPLKC